MVKYHFRVFIPKKIMQEGDAAASILSADQVLAQAGPAASSEVAVEDTPETYRALKYKCRQLQKRVRYLGSKLGSMRYVYSITRLNKVQLISIINGRTLLLKTRAETEFLSAKAKQLESAKKT